MDLEYSVIAKSLTPFQMARVIKTIEDSNKIELCDELPGVGLSHIVIKGTQIPVGYLGDDTLEKVNPGDQTLKPYHKLLRAIYDYSSLYNLN